LEKRLASVGGGRIELLVGERQLTAQLFLRANGFQAVCVQHGSEDRDDAYVFDKPCVPVATRRPAQSR
jgi:hypothetical protein